MTEYRLGSKYLEKILLLVIIISSPMVTMQAQNSVARQWNEALLQSIRLDFARPTVHARNLFHTSVAMYDAWALYEEEPYPFLVGNKIGDFQSELPVLPSLDDPKPAQEEAMSYACYQILKYRFADAPGYKELRPMYNELMTELGYDTTFTATDYTSGSPAALGNYIAETIINFGKQDGANEVNNYGNKYYVPSNPPLEMDEPGNPNIVDANRWQQLKLKVFIDQSGNVLPITARDFIGPEWGQVKPFSLSENDVKIYNRDGSDYWVYHDPGPPPYLDTSNIGGLSEEYKWGFSLVAGWSAHLDPVDGIVMDISPASIGNISNYPETIEGLRSFYDFSEGGDPGDGRPINPITGQPYEPQMVPRGDYTRVLAEFWADGPDSETPPGHWFTILNYVSDHPQLSRRFGGTGNELEPLEWDVKSYLALGGAMHDVAVTAWGIKGWYDYVRPVSAIRYMAGKGQSSDSTEISYHPAGIHLVPGRIEVVKEGDILEGNSLENVGKIKLRAWRGPNFIFDPEVDKAGVGWILAENWWPYQRPSFVTPPFAGYISGHSTYSSAAAVILTNLTGDEYFPGGLGEFEAPEKEFLVFEDGPSTDLTLQWATYKDAADQCSLSRIWGGIHPPADDIPGRKIGRIIGEDAFDLAASLFYKDSDGDGYLSYEDCDDTDSLIHPGAQEIMDGRDNNCDGEIDSVITSNSSIDQVNLKIWPNPTSEIINIESPEHIISGLRCYDSTGRLMEKMNSTGSSRSITLTVKNYSSGVYILQLFGSSGEVIASRKILIANND